MNTKSIGQNLDRTLAAVLAVVGVLMLILGWFGASGKALAAQQLPYLISGGLGAVVLVAIACTLWISADLQDEWRQMDLVESKLDQLIEDHLHRVEQDRYDVDRESVAAGTKRRRQLRADA